jgi:F-type H+-transporting ATPase subunit b
MEERKNLIEEDINKAKQSRESASKFEQEYKIRLTQIDEEAKSILQKAVIEGKKNKEDIIKEAQEEAKKIIEKAKGEIDKEKLQIKNELQKEVVGLSILMAEKILKESVNKQIQQKLLNEFADRLKK